MKFSINRAKTTIAVALVLLLASVTLMANVSVQPAKAQLAPVQPYSGPLKAGDTPNITVTTTAYMSIRPAVVGLGQVFMVNLFPIPAPHAGRVFRDMKVTITKPDGTQEVITVDSYPADGTAWFEYIADQVGTWKFKFDFPGMYFPAGIYNQGPIVTTPITGVTTNYTDSAYYKPSSTPEMKITVQQDIVYSWPPSPLPTDYWTRPVAYEHREWAPIIGNWPWHGPGGKDWDKYYPNTNPYWGGTMGAPGGGIVRGHFTPWVQAPNSAHVAWKKQMSLAGIIGGDYGVEIYNVDIFGNSLGYYPYIICAGRGYQTITKVMPRLVNGTTRNLPTSVLQCYDIRTGEVFWEQTDTPTPTVIEYFDQGLLPGGATTGVHEHVTSINLLYIGGGYLVKYSPFTGLVTLNVSISPLTTGTYHKNGYALTLQDLGAAAGALRYRLINWTTFGTTANFTARIQSNITWPWSSFPATTDFNVGISVITSKSYVAGAPNTTTVRAASLTTGASLWNITLDEWEYSTNTQYADHGKFAMLTEQGYFLALDLYSGKLAWKSDKFDYPWDEPGFGGYNVLSAYGLLYRNAYTGIYAFNWTNGKLAWKYTAPAGATYETPYVDPAGQTVYSWNIGGAIADGKYYAYTTEHSATVPITRGWGLHCINATTGEKIWSVAIPGASSKHQTDIGPIADGYLTLFSSDGYMYVFGKGKSQTTVTAPDVAVPKGTAITIKGTVLDMSPAQPGTPCVSKESMALQMEYLHKQMPLAGIWGNETITGVPVTLTAIDSKGNVIDIGTVTTNGYYGTFGAAWTPPNEDTYEIIASFAGDDSYGSSAASTFVTVGPAPEPYPEPIQPEPPIDTTPTIIGTGIAIIIAVAIVGILLFRKRP